MKTEKDFKYKTSFASRVQKISNAELDKYISLAGLEQLKGLMPDSIKLNENPDLIGIALNCAVAGKANLNGDSITNETATQIVDNFIYKFVDLNHNRTRIIGCIANSGFSTFGPNKLITKEDVIKTNDPVNISLACLLWKAALNDEFIKLLEESVDETSANYGRLSGSWELYFNYYDIAIGPSRNLNEAQIIDEKERDKFESLLQSSGGNGKKDDKFVYRIIKGETLIPGAIGLVEFPAATVKGLEIINNDKNILEEKTKSNSNIIEISQNQNNSVIENDNLKDKEINKAMTIKTIKELTDENLKECKASTVIELFENGIKEADVKWRAEKESKDKAIAELEDKNKKFMTEAEENQKRLEILTKKMEEFAKQALAKEMLEKFNTRMSYFDSEYELDDEDRSIIKDDIKEMNDEVFAAYSKKMGKLLKNKKKGQKKDDKHMMDKEEMDKNMSKASVNDDTTKKIDDTTKVVDGAVDNAQKANSTLPNTNSNINEDWQSKYKDAFKFENCVEVGKSRK